MQLTGRSHQTEKKRHEDVTSLGLPGALGRHTGGAELAVPASRVKRYIEHYIEPNGQVKDPPFSHTPTRRGGILVEHITIAPLSKKHSHGIKSHTVPFNSGQGFNALPPSHLSPTAVTIVGEMGLRDP